MVHCTVQIEYEYTVVSGSYDQGKTYDAGRYQIDRYCD